MKKRIKQQLINDLTKQVTQAIEQGYIFPTDITSMFSKMSVSELKELSKRDRIYKKSYSVSEETGELSKVKSTNKIKSKQKQEEKKDIYIPEGEEIIIDNFIEVSNIEGLKQIVLDTYYDYLDSKDRNYLKVDRIDAKNKIIACIDRVLSSDKDTINHVSHLIQQHSIELNEAIQRIFFDSDASRIQIALNTIMEVLNEGVMTQDMSKEIGEIADNYYDDEDDIE